MAFRLSSAKVGRQDTKIFYCRSFVDTKRVGKGCFNFGIEIIQV